MPQGRKPKYDNKIKRILTSHAGLRASKITKLLNIPYSQTFGILQRLQREGEIVRHGMTYMNSDTKWKTVAMQTSGTPVKTMETIQPVEKFNPSIDALKAELEYIRTTVNNLVQTGEYIKARIKELGE